MEELIQKLVSTRRDLYARGTRLYERADGSWSDDDLTEYDAIAEEIRVLDDRIEELHETLQASKRAEEYADVYAEVIAPDSRSSRMSSERFKTDAPTS